MKRLLALLLAITFIICAFAACGDDNATESDASSEVSSASSGGDESKVSKREEKIALIQSYLNTDVDRTMKAENIFKGMSYKSSREANSTYPDGSNKLTDGTTMDIFNNVAFVGWNGGKAVNVDFDLGSNEHKLADINVGCLKQDSYGIGMPKYVSLQVSNDGETYTEISKIVTPADLPSSVKYNYRFNLAKATDARYIRIHFADQSLSFLFVDEICGYEYSENGTIDMSIAADASIENTVLDFYEYNLNTGESDVKVSESDSDYNETQNLMALEGVDIQVAHFEALAENHENTPADKLSMLTDGYTAGNINDYYIAFQRGGGRHIVADLGHIMAIDGCTTSFFDKPSWGTYLPAVYCISLSENGTDWVTVHAEVNDKYGIEEKGAYTNEIKFAQSYKARYVRITFEVNPFVHMSEWVITGRKNPAGAVTAVENESTPYGKYVDKEKYGVSNILFAMVADTYGVHSADKHVFNEDTAYHYLASVDENDNATGVFFDSVTLAMRGSLYQHTKIDEAYSFFLDEIFYDGLNCDALDSAMAKVNEQLKTNDKLKLWITVQAPAVNDTFNGKAVTTAEDAIACLKWQVDEAKRRFNEKNYKNIELVGFYWQHECVREMVPFDEDTMIAFNKYVHSSGLLTLWCPYFNAYGIWKNHILGFDISCLQPNYMFSVSTESRLTSAAELAKLYGMCVEIETEGGTQSVSTVSRYRNYLKYGYDYGYMNSVKMYYQGGVPGAYAQYWNSTDELAKSVYDDTVLYAAEKLNGDYNKTSLADISNFTDQEINVVSGSKYSLPLGDVSYLTYRVSQMPMYGSLQFDQSGTICYSPLAGYEGEDEIKIELFDNLSEIKTITIKCNVSK